MTFKEFSTVLLNVTAMISHIQSIIEDIEMQIYSVTAKNVQIAERSTRPFCARGIQIGRS